MSAPIVTPELGRLFTVHDVAQTFGVTERTVFNWLSQSRLPFVRVGGTTRIPESELVALVQKPEPVSE